MQKKIVTRCLSAAGVFVIIAFARVASSVAAIPDNDNFANATIISALPFSDSGNLTGTAMEPGEPQFCNFLTQTVWYRLTPTTNKTIKVKLTGSDDSANFSVYQTGGVGAFGLNFLGCAGGSTGSFQLDISAGSTYYIQAGSAVFGAHLQIGIDEILPPSNDNFAAATPIQAIPFIDIVDLTRATVESLEPVQPTPFDTIVASAWYAVSPAVSQSLTVSAANTCCTSPFIAVFTGGSLPTLTRVNASSSPGQKVTFRADAGTTYFIQLGRAFMSLSAVMTFRVESRPGRLPAASVELWRRYASDRRISDPSLCHRRRLHGHSGRDHSGRSHRVGLARHQRQNARRRHHQARGAERGGCRTDPTPDRRRQQQPRCPAGPGHIVQERAWWIRRLPARWDVDAAGRLGYFRQSNDVVRFQLHDHRRGCGRGQGDLQSGGSNTRCARCAARGQHRDRAADESESVSCRGGKGHRQEGQELCPAFPALPAPPAHLAYSARNIIAFGDTR